jgi:hypothetical protein
MAPERESERCFEGELFDGVEADAVGDEQGKLEKGGAGRIGCAEDGVVGEPRVLCERESSCEEKPSRSARATAAPSSG